MPTIILALIIIGWLASIIWTIIEITSEKLERRTILAFIVLLGMSTILISIIFAAIAMDI